MRTTCRSANTLCILPTQLMTHTIKRNLPPSSKESYSRLCLCHGGRAPIILYLGTRWSSVIHFMPQPLFSRGINPGTVPTEQSRPESFGKDKNFLHLMGCETWTVQPLTKQQYKKSESRGELRGDQM